VRFGGIPTIHRGRGRGDVVVEQPVKRRATYLGRVFDGGEVGGVGPEQIVHGVPAGAGRVHEVRSREQVQRVASLSRPGAGQRGGGVRIDVGTGVHAQPAEGLGGVGWQVLNRPGEHSLHAGVAVIAAGQQVQSPLLIGQLDHQIGQRRGVAGDRQLGGDPQCQRQPGALFGEGGRGVRLGVDPVADQPVQQRHRIAGREQVQAEPAGAVRRDQPGEPVAAGHHHRAGAAARQQRPDLFGGGGVVQHDKHPPAGDLAAVAVFRWITVTI
jgi:hypothetical protein